MIDDPGVVRCPETGRILNLSPLPPGLTAWWQVELPDGGPRWECWKATNRTPQQKYQGPGVSAFKQGFCAALDPDPVCPYQVGAGEKYNFMRYRRRCWLSGLTSGRRYLEQDSPTPLAP